MVDGAQRSGRAAPAWLRALLGTAAVLGGLGSAASTPVHTELPTLVAHAQRGDVRLVQLQTGARPPGFHLRVGNDDALPRLLWLDRHGVRHVVVLHDRSPTGPLGDLDGGESSAVRQDVVATLRLASPLPVAERQPGTLLRERLASVGDLTGLLLVLAVMVGPQPRRATKWAWAWLVALPPWGLGQVLLLWREAPWSPDTTAEPEPADRHDRTPGVRTSGGVAVVSLLLLLSAGWLVGQLLSAALPFDDTLAPAPYEVVQVDGSRVPGPLSP